MGTHATFPAPAGALVFPWDVPGLAGDGTTQQAVGLRLPPGLFVCHGIIVGESSGPTITFAGVGVPDADWTVIAGGISPDSVVTDTAVRVTTLAVLEVPGGNYQAEVWATTTGGTGTVDSVGALVFVPAIDATP